MPHTYPTALRFLAFVLAAYASGVQAQFPLSLSMTGDTAYPAQPDVAPLFATPMPGALMMVADHEGAPWLMGLNDYGNVSQDQAIDTVPLELRDAAAHSSGMVLVGRNAAQHPFVGMTTGFLGPYAWTDAPAINGTYISATSMANGDVLAIGRRDIAANVLSPYIRRYTVSGSLLWTNTTGIDDICYTTAGLELSDGSLLFTGISGPPVPTNLRTYCQRLSATGSLLANEQVGTLGYQVGSRVLPLDASHAMILANKDFPFSMLTVKVESATCTEVSTHSFDGLKASDAYYDDFQNNYVVVGQRTFGGAWLGRFDLNGDSLWTSDLPETAVVPRHIQPDGPDGSLIIGSLMDLPYLLRVDDDELLTNVADVNDTSTLLRVVPNPSTENARLQCRTPLGAAVRWEMRDASGRTIREGIMPANGELLVERKGLDAGLYLFRLRDHRRTLGSVRWVVL
ncbi:MAG: hypothetical protein KA352_08705 [Flavobacteriales bacterium]|nr:hypothetical protein [Flavobacteriales bacterium]